jgi:predicted metal-dependent phosphoesterase TrpH
MMTFMRNKLVGVEKGAGNTYRVHGLLDDHIYSLEVELQVDAAAMTISALQGRWKRCTTPDCPRALGLLDQAVGLCLSEEDFSQRVHKLVGRQACRHFANLILECCDCVRKAAALEAGELAAPPARPSGSPQAPAGPAEAASGQAAPAQAAPPAAGGPQAYARLEDAPEGFFIDLHVHTFPASSCASAGVDEVIAEAKRIGLNGICLTDHNHAWDPAELERLSQRHDFLVLGGNEVTTAQGDMVVFGLAQEIKGVITLAELRQKAGRAGGFIIAAHPFRGFLAVGVDELGLEVDQAAQRPMFQLVDAMETLNSKVTPSENRFCAQVAAALGRPATGGSDAHDASEVGINATRFPKVIKSQADLLAALRHGSYQPVAFRQLRKVD